MDTTIKSKVGPDIKAAPPDTRFAEAMKRIENDLCEVVNMSYVVSDMAERMETGEDANGHKIFRCYGGEQDAFLFAVYNLDGRIRKLKAAYYAGYEAYGEKVA